MGLFNNLRERFEEGGLIFTPSVENNKYYDDPGREPVDVLTNEIDSTEYEGRGSDGQQPKSDATYSPDYSRLDLVGQRLNNPLLNTSTYGPENTYESNYEARTGIFRNEGE